MVAQMRCIRVLSLKMNDTNYWHWTREIHHSQVLLDVSSDDE